jgi:hypothetical protein
MKFLYTFLFCISLLSINLQAEDIFIQWDSLGQEKILPKNQSYTFIYSRNVSADWTYIELEDLEDKHKFTLRTHSVSRVDTVMIPDTIIVPCDSEDMMEFVYTGGFVSDRDRLEAKSRQKRTILVEKFNQKDTVLYCEEVALAFHGIQPEDCEIVYEQIDKGYILKFINERRLEPIVFRCLCQKFYLFNPWNKQISFDENLKYEQIIMTPMANGMWEVRIGTTKRGCKSKALKNIQKLRTREYEKKLPKCLNK